MGRNVNYCLSVCVMEKIVLDIVFALLYKIIKDKSRLIIWGRKSL